MIRVRSSTVSLQTGNLLRMTFPNAGLLSASASLGIAWANPSNPNALLGPLNGLDFQNGCQYQSLNLRVLDYEELRPDFSLSLIVVDSSGADLYTIGQTTIDVNAELFVFGAISFLIGAHSTPGAGIRGQLNIGSGGAMSVFIPTPLIYYGG